MKKLFLSVLLYSFSAQAQITLEHSFSPVTIPAGSYTSESLYHVYSNDTDTFYWIYDGNDNTIKMYNSDYSFRKSFNITVPAGYYLDNFTGNENDDTEKFVVTKNIFNTDDNYEFFVTFEQNQNSGNDYHRLFKLISDNGNVVYDFGKIDEFTTIRVFHDAVVNKNKLLLDNVLDNNNNILQNVYLLPTTQLGNKEIEDLHRKSAYPNPAVSEINIPVNNASGILKIYNANGQLVESKNVEKGRDYQKVSTEKFAKGFYIYEFNGNSGKFLVK
ncbi:MAG: T9SS type A sorting domain-containing protein [Bergeyella sp.]